MSVLHITIKDKVQTIALPALFNSQALQEFEAESKTWLLGDANMFVLDFKKVTALSNNEYRVLLSFCTTANRAEKKVVSVHISSTLQKQLKKDGVIDKFNIFDLRPA